MSYVVFGEERAIHIHQDYSIIIRLEEVLHLYSPQLQNEEVNAGRRRLLAYLGSFIDKWFYDNEVDWTRKCALDRAAVYGIKSKERGTVL